MKCEIREICGDWALDIQCPRETVTIYFNSRRNALNVKRILEVDASIPNAATVCDMVEVVRCGKCKHSVFPGRYGECELGYIHPSSKFDYCSRGERKDDGV